MMIWVIALLVLSGCTINKAVYFEAAEGTINAHGVSIQGKGLKYHSVPCELADCQPHLPSIPQP